MAITITSTMTGASANYERYLYGQLTRTDRIKDSLLLDFSLAPVDASFVKLTRGAYITVSTSTYGKWFTGYVVNDPELTYLGSKGGLPVWGYKYQATSDEYVLSLKPLGITPPFMNVTMGQIIKTLAEKLVPGMFDTTGVQNGPIVAQYAVDPSKKFIEVCQELCESAAFRLYAMDKKLYFVPQGVGGMGTVVLDGNDKHFTPSNLEIRPANTTSALANDITVLGDAEPQAYVKEYFVGTGLDSTFSLAAGVFGADSSILLDEVFSNSSVDNSKWSVFDPSGSFAIGNGYLNVTGGSSYNTRLVSKNAIPMDGRLRLTHGDWRLTSGSGVIGGLWNATVNTALNGCLYGIYYDGSYLAPITNGVVDGAQYAPVSASKRYVLRTVVEFTKSNRTKQTYNYLDSTGTVKAISGDGEPDEAVWETLISEVDPTNGNVTNQWTFRNTSTLAGLADLYASYVPVAANSMNAAFTGVTISIPVNATLEIATRVGIVNDTFDEWSGSDLVGWSLVGGAKEEVIIDSNTALRLTASSGGTASATQSVAALLTSNTPYNVMIRLKKSAPMLAGNVSVSLQGTGFSVTKNIPVSAISSSLYGFHTTTLTDGMLTVPEDLAIAVSLVGCTPGASVYIDSLVVMSQFVKKLVGPNELDGLDGMAPIATIVSSNVGSETTSTYFGNPQYNSGQAQLTFFKDSTTFESNVPLENQIIRLSYRSAGPAIGRSVNRSSMLTESSSWGDDGVRSIVRTDLVPRPRTSEECEMAAASLVAENSYSHYEGSYWQWSMYFTEHPRAGSVIQFSNLSNMAPVSYEEITEVVSTVESNSTERFKHTLTFGKPDITRQLLQKFLTPTSTYQQASGTVDISAVDVSALNGSGIYASDASKAELTAWSPNALLLNMGEALASDELFYEVRYTDEGWGVDDGLNLVSRTTNQLIPVSRNLRGRTYFIRKAKLVNHLLWSEDQTKGTYTGVSVSLPMYAGPDGKIRAVGESTFSQNSSLSGSVSGLSGSTFCGTLSIKAPAGKTWRLQLGSSTKTFTTTGYWQRVSVPHTGTAPTNFSLTYTGEGSATAMFTQWSVEQGTLVERYYAKTTSIKYGPTSRYSCCIKVSFPYVETITEESTVRAIGDVTGIAAVATIGETEVVIDVTATAPVDDLFSGCEVFLEIPQELDENPASPTMPGQLYYQGWWFAESGSSIASQIKVPLPPTSYLQTLASPIVTWHIYLLPRTWSYCNEFVRLTDASTLEPSNHTPVVAVTMDFTSYLIEAGDTLGAVNITSTSVAAAGDDSVAITIKYMPPHLGVEGATTIGDFVGVDAYYAVADEVNKNVGKFPYEGVYGVGPPDEYGEVTIVVPKPAVLPATVAIQLPSYSTTKSRVPNKLSWVGEVPWNVPANWGAVVTITATALAFTAPTISNVVVETRDVPGEGWSYRLKTTLSGSFANHANYEGTTLYYKASDEATPSTDSDWLTLRQVGSHAKGNGLVVYSDWYTLQAETSETAYIKAVATETGNKNPQWSATYGPFTITLSVNTVVQQVSSTGLTVSVSEYTNGEDGSPYAKVAGSFTFPSGVDIVSGYVCIKPHGHSTTPSPDDFTGMFTTSSGTFEFWTRRPQDGARVFVLLTSANALNGIWRPVDSSCPIAYTDIAAWGMPSAPTGCSVVVQNSRTIDGVEFFDLAINFTAPTSADYWYMKVGRILRANSSYAPLAGATYEQNGDFGEASSFIVRDIKRPATAEYWTYRFRPVNWQEVPNDSAVVTVNVTINASGGLDLSATKASSIFGLEVVSGQLRPRLSSEFVLDAAGKVTQQTVDLLKAIGFDTSLFHVSGGVFTQKAIATDLLVASLAIITSSLRVGGGAAYVMIYPTGRIDIAGSTGSMVISGGNIDMTGNLRAFTGCNVKGLFTFTKATGGDAFYVMDTGAAFTVPLTVTNLAITGTVSGLTVSYGSIIGLPTYFPTSWANVASKPTSFPVDWTSVSGKPTVFPSWWSGVSDKPTYFPTTWGVVANKPSWVSEDFNLHWHELDVPPTLSIVALEYLDHSGNPQTVEVAVGYLSNNGSTGSPIY